MALDLLALSFDCADAERLAGFWGAALGRPVNPGATAGSASVGVTDVASTGPRLLFHQVPEPKAVKNRLHLDLVTQVTEAETERLLSLGASVLRVFEENGRHRWTTFADPEGNEFDLITG